MADHIDTQHSATNDGAAAPATALLSAGLGVAAVVAALVPGLFLLAWLLAAAALVAARPGLESGESERTLDAALVGHRAGVAAIILGVLNLGIALGWFSFFTAG